ncbi:MAG: sigma factor [Acidimicrobiia bacterium]
MGEELDGVLDAAQAGAGWALEVLYRQLAPAVAGYQRVQGTAEPDDLTNEVFVRVFRDLGAFSGTDAQFRSWVFSIAHARLVDDRRRQARRIQLEQLGVIHAGQLDAAGALQDSRCHGRPPYVHVQSNA